MVGSQCDRQGIQWNSCYVMDEEHPGFDVKMEKLDEDHRQIYEQNERQLGFEVKTEKPDDVQGQITEQDEEHLVFKIKIEKPDEDQRKTEQDEEQLGFEIKTEKLDEEQEQITEQNEEQLGFEIKMEELDEEQGQITEQNENNPSFEIEIEWHNEDQGQITEQNEEHSSFETEMEELDEDQGQITEQNEEHPSFETEMEVLEEDQGQLTEQNEKQLSSEIKIEKLNEDQGQITEQDEEKQHSSETVMEEIDEDQGQITEQQRMLEVKNNKIIKPCSVRLKRLSYISVSTDKSSSCVDTHDEHPTDDCNISMMNVEDDNMAINDEVSQNSTNQHSFQVTDIEGDTAIDPSSKHDDVVRDIAGNQKKPKLKKPMRPCLFCGKLQSKLALHITRKHHLEDRVKAALKLPKCLRDRAFDSMRKDGIFEANKKVMMNQDLSEIEKEKQFLRERRQGKSNLVMCSFCHGFYSSHVIHKHKSTCPDGEATTNIPVSIPVSLSFEEKGSKEFREKILSKFRSDEVGKLCTTDPFIRILGLNTFAKIKTRIEKNGELKDSLMADMRRMGTLFKEFKTLVEQDKKNVSSCFEMFDRTYFNYLREAIENVSTSEDGSVKFGLKSSIGSLLKKAARILKGYYLIQKEDEEAAEVDNFITVLTCFWTSIFSDAEYANEKTRQTDLGKPKCLPREDDVQKLRTYNVDELKKFENPCIHITKTDFKCLRDLLVCRLTLFNARRGGEPSRLLLQEWQDAENGTWISEESVQNISDPIEKQFLGKYKIAYQSGKNLNQVVPLLIPNDCVKGMQILAKEEIRKKVSVLTGNPFMFPNISHSDRHVKGWHAVESVCTKAGLLQTITATSMRHRAATLYAVLDIPENERQVFYRYMGHSEDVNRNVYQCLMAVQEVVKVRKCLESSDNSSERLSTSFANEGQMLSDQTSENEVVAGPSSDLCENVTTESELSSSSKVQEESDEEDEEYLPSSDTDKEDEETVEENKREREQSVRGLKKRSNDGQRHQWSLEDTKLVRSAFKSYVENTTSYDRKGSLPGKKAVEIFIRKHPSFFPDTPEKKKLQLVRTKIYNERNKTRKSVEKKLKSLRQ